MVSYLYILWFLEWESYSFDALTQSSFRNLCILFCHCLRIFNFLLNYLARNCSGCFILLAKYKLIMAFMSRLLPGGYFSMSCTAFASPTIALSFSNSYHFWLHPLFCYRVNAGKNVKCQNMIDRTIYTYCGWEMSFSVTPLFFTVHGHYHGVFCAPVPVFYLTGKE